MWDVGNFLLDPPTKNETREERDNEEGKKEAKVWRLTVKLVVMVAAARAVQ